MVDTSKLSSSVPSVDLPDIFPQQNLVVNEEAHTFNVFQKDYSTEAQTAYELNKAPVKNIIRVVGEYQNQTIEFTVDVDYTLSQDSERIVWDENERTPTAGTEFFVTYESDSILKRYLESADDEMEITQQSIVESVNKKFIDTASGENLDRIGARFGEIVGARRGRDDSDYRSYLKSVVQSFISRGTISGIKTAISAATGAKIENILIDENFDENTYDVVVIPKTPVAGSTIEEIAEIADPSGVEQRRTVFELDDENIFLQDGVGFTEGLQNSDEMFVSDAGSVNPDLTTLPPELLGMNDVSFVNPNLTTTPSDGSSVDDDNSINPNLSETAESVSLNDSTEIPTVNLIDEYKWSEPSPSTDDNVNWNFFEWIEITDLGTFLISGGTTASVDFVLIDPDTEIVSDISLSDDTVFIDKNNVVLVDDSLSNDFVTLDTNKTSTNDVSKSVDESVETIRDKNTFRWDEYGSEVKTDGDEWGLNWGTFSWSNSPKRPTVGEWNFMEWTEITSLPMQTVGDTGLSRDRTLINQNTLTSVDIPGSADEAIVDKNTKPVTDTTSSSDTDVETIRAINSFKWGQYEQTEVSPSGDNWDSLDWGTIEWAEGPTLKASSSGDKWSFMEWTAET